MHSPFFSFALRAILVAAVPSTSNTNNGTGAASSKCLFPARYLTQRIDHFGQNNGTFQQKYYMSTDYYQPGGPILLFQGEESTYLDCVESTILYNFAQDLNGIVVALEHRYFGESKPFGPAVQNYTADQWKYLTIDNVMQDAVSFVESIKHNVTGAEGAPVFAASGSYGGFLMTLFRQNHPEMFDGVIASAPSLRGFFGENDTNVQGQFNWWNYISRTYWQQSAEAEAKIQQAFAVLRERFLSNDISGLQEEFRLCNPVTTNSSANLGKLAALLQEVYSSSVEFNYVGARPGRSPIAKPLEKSIAVALETDDPLEILNRTNWLWWPQSAANIGEKLTCLPWQSPEQWTRLIAPTIERTPFEYITCTYLSFDGSSIGNDTIFLPTGDPALSHLGAVESCRAQYGVSAPPAQELYRKYHFTTEELQNSTGIIFSLAEFDPTTSIAGPFDFVLPLHGDPHASRRLFTTGMAHREDLFVQDNMTKETVKATNAIELQILKEWMKIASKKKSG